MKKYESVDYKRIPMFAGVTAEQWNDWHWQVANVITDTEALSRVIDMR